MEDVYWFNPMLSSSQDPNIVPDHLQLLHRGPANHVQPQRTGSHSHMPHPDHQVIKTQIANHPLYPNLLSAYIECQKVGAPPQVASLLEEISREKHPSTVAHPHRIGDDPQLDHFMESYCQVLHRYKEELSRPFNEATLFLTNIQSQLTNLCKGTFTNSSSDHPSDEAGMSSGEELSCDEEVEAGEGGGGSSSKGSDNKEIKEMLVRKYSGYLSNLRKEFLKTRKKGKLPKDARMALLNWWNAHYRWPYPTEEEKVKLSEVSGLNQKQINNWFINQRKRHWKPSEDMRFGIMQGVSAGPIYFDSPPQPQPQPHHS